MTYFMRTLLCFLLIAVSGCGTTVFRAGFNEQSNGPFSSQYNDIYFPPENPKQDRIHGEDLSIQTVTFSSNPSLGYGTTLMIQPITPAKRTNSSLSFESIDIPSSHNKYSMAWSGRKQGNNIIDCHFGWASDTDSAPEETYGFTIRFGDGKVFLFYFNGTPMELGALPNDAEHRVFVTVRPDSDNFSVYVSNANIPGIEKKMDMSPGRFENVDELRVKCSYDGSAPAQSNHYLFDKMEFKSSKA
ncbi:hypothetical protein [Aliiglaciecola litoralis]|uniref:Lipoprotein n=1 Tax=Aliiglaciecola litoralis TaxID=582857 RepID=A0ABN1LD46_9ALTE